MAVVKFLFYLIAYSLIRLGILVDQFFNFFLSVIKKTKGKIKKFTKKIKSHSLKLPRFVLPSLSLPTLKKPKISLKIKRKEKSETKSKPTYATFSQTDSYKQRFLSKLKYFSFGVIFSSLFIFLPLVSYVFIADLPTLDGLSVNEIPKTTKLYDRNGELLYEIYANQNRTIVNLSDIPDYLEQATIAIEDQNFYSHPGFDLRGISRAILANITDDNLQGGSTITQQLIKSALLTPEPTLTRKAKEVVLALWAEQKYSKDEILELYFNYVPYGGTAWGVQAASEVYFGKNVSELSLSEAAFLAGLPRAPSIYSPYINSENSWRQRQWDVLQAMVRDGYLTQEKAYNAYQSPLVFNNPQTSIKAPHFVMYVKDELVKKYGLYQVERGGLHVTTTLDMNIQRYVEDEVKKTVDENGYLGIGNAAALVTDPRNGDVLAMVGSSDFFDEDRDGNVNLTTSLRQPGSTIKLVTYAAALESGFTEASVINDSPVTIKVEGSDSYRPVNYDGRYHGMVPLRIAFANSYNIPAVRIAEKLGAKKILEYGQKMGISSWKSDMPYGLSITLGGNEVTMLDLATAYGVIANKGQKVNIDPILSIKDSKGEIVSKKRAEAEQVINSGVAFIISDILADNRSRSSAFGVNSPLNIPGKRVSVKTGTTDNKRDNWTIGFTDEFVVTTWVGNNDNTPLSPTLASGITGAAPLWRSIMDKVTESEVGSEIAIPDNVSSKNCFGYTAYFLSGTENTNCRIQRPSPTFRQQ